MLSAKKHHSFGIKMDRQVGKKYPVLVEDLLNVKWIPE